MTAGAVVLPERAEARAAGYLGARALEFLAVGGATLLLWPLAWSLRRVVGLDEAEYAAGFATFYAAYVLNDPHFAVTYLLFYKDVRRRALDPVLDRAQRARYVVAGFVVPLVLASWAGAALALRSAQALGWMVQLMFLLVGWHYAKQGFGVLAVLSARRGAPLTRRERAAFLAHAYVGWAFAWANPAAPAGVFEEKGVVYRAIAHPRWLELTAGAALAVSAAAVVWVLAERWRRDRRLPPLAPLAGFFVTLWSWTIFSSADPVLRYAIPALHSAQYLYFVWLMKRNEARAEEGPPAFGRPVPVRLAFLAFSSLALGWVVFHGAPELLDAASVARARRGPVDELGATPFFAAIFVAVNIHHYFMDHVLWRRENPDTRWLREPLAPDAAQPRA